MNDISTILISLCFTWHFSFGDTMTGKIIDVIDGNTVQLLAEGNETYTIALYGIDCPELHQPYGDQAKQLLEEMMAGKEVKVIILGKDRWGIRQAIILPEGGPDPRIALLSNGLAWTTERNVLNDLEAIRCDAQADGKGLWRDKSPIAPWTYRRNQTMLVPKSR